MACAANGLYHADTVLWCRLPQQARLQCSRRPQEQRNRCSSQPSPMPLPWHRSASASTQSSLRPSRAAGSCSAGHCTAGKPAAWSSIKGAYADPEFCNCVVSITTLVVSDLLTQQGFGSCRPARTISLPASARGSGKISCLSPKVQGDVTRHGLLASELRQAQLSLGDGGSFQAPHYSLCVAS